jgi:hypothetical protein
MSLPCRSYAFLFAIINCVLFLSAPVLAGDKVDGKRFFELESGGPHYANAHELCAAKAKERHDDKSVDRPYDHLVGERDDGANVWCNLADSNGDENDQHFGSEGWECPANSERANYGCECEQDYESTGKTCKKKGILATDEKTSARPQNIDHAHEKPAQVKRPPLLVQVEIKPIAGEAQGWRQLEQPTRASYGAIGIITEGGGYEGVATYDRLTGKVELKVSKIGEGSSAGEVYQIGQIPPGELADITAKSGGNPNKFGNLAEAPIRKLISNATGQEVLDSGKSASKTGVDWRPQQPPLPHIN